MELTGTLFSILFNTRFTEVLFSTPSELLIQLLQQLMKFIFLLKNMFGVIVSVF